jgi:tripartite-type tricarboxylate transporter receptor subunit TctC
MGTLAGLIVGYMVGAGTGTEGYRKLRDAWQEIQASDEWKGLVTTASGFVQNALARGGEALAGQVERTASLQHLLSSRMELLGDILEQGKAALRDAPPAGRP